MIPSSLDEKVEGLSRAIQRAMQDNSFQVTAEVRWLGSVNSEGILAVWFPVNQFYSTEACLIKKISTNPS